MVEEVAALQIRLEATTAKFERQIKRAEQQLARRSRQMERRSEKLDRKLSMVGKRFGQNIAARAAAAVVSIAAIGKVISDVARNGDKFKVLEARFTALTNSADRGQQVFDNVLGIVTDTGVSIDDAASAITRFTLAAQSIGATDDEVRQLTSNIIKLGQIGGSTQQELASGAVQLAQALASGRLQGDELRSILENMPLVARAIAEGLGVGVGELRKMGSEGELTARKVFDAILGKTDEVERRFGELPVTLDRAAGQLAGSWAKFTAQLDESLGVSEALVAVLQKASLLLDDISRVDGPDEKLIGDIARLQEIEASMSTLTGPFRERAQEMANELRQSISSQTRKHMQPRTPSAASPGAAAVSRSSARRTRSGGRAAPKADTESAAAFVQTVQRRIEALNQERGALGLTGQALVSYEANIEAARIQQELLDLAARENTVVTQEQREQIRQLSDVYVILTENIGREREALEAASQAAEEAQAAQEEFAVGVVNVLGSAITEAESFEEALKRIGVQLAQLAITDLFSQNSVILGALGFAGGLFAKGGAFKGGRVTPFAQGGVVSSPTLFPMSGGAGLMGEAGPEAIMPLSKGPDGKLGIKAEVGGRAGPASNVFHIDARGAQEGVSKQIADALDRYSRRQSTVARNDALRGR